MLDKRERCLMEKHEKLGELKPNIIFETSASFLGDTYEGTVFTFTNNAQAAEAPRLRSSSVTPCLSPLKKVSSSKLAPTESKAVLQMRESMMFPEVWNPYKQPTLPIINNNTKMKNVSHCERTGITAASVVQTSCSDLPLQQRLRRIRTREERSDANVKDQAEEGIHREDSGNGGVFDMEAKSKLGVKGNVEADKIRNGKIDENGESLKLKQQLRQLIEGGESAKQECDVQEVPTSTHLSSFRQYLQVLIAP